LQGIRSCPVETTELSDVTNLLMLATIGEQMGKRRLYLPAIAPRPVYSKLKQL